jgi:hypothetical protein
MTAVSIPWAKLKGRTRDTVVVALTWLEFCVRLEYPVYEWTILTFWLDYFAFWTQSTQTPCVPGILHFRKPKAPEFSIPDFWKKGPWKMSLFVEHGFSPSRFWEIWNPLETIGRFLGPSRSVHGCIQHKNACFWVSVDRYALHLVVCKIRRWVVHLGSWK